MIGAEDVDLDGPSAKGGAAMRRASTHLRARAAAEAEAVELGISLVWYCNSVLYGIGIVPMIGGGDIDRVCRAPYGPARWCRCHSYSPVPVGTRHCSV